MKIQLEPGDEVAALCPFKGGFVAITRMGRFYYLSYSEREQQFSVERL